MIMDFHHVHYGIIDNVQKQISVEREQKGAKRKQIILHG